jgi:hypothetical protein
MKKHKKTEWLSLCQTHRIPAAVAAQVQAGLIKESSLPDHADRDEWAGRYERELEIEKTGGGKKLKRHRAREIARALGLLNRSGQIDTTMANAILNGTYTPYQAMQEARRRQERWERERIIEKDIPQVSRELAEQVGTPKEMAAEVVKALPLEQVTLEAAQAAWAERVQASGFSTVAELVAAWKEHRVWTADDLQYRRERALRKQNAGMLPDALSALCGADYIVDTLRAIFHLNHWAKARDRLLYLDRQGLYQVKARILREAYRQGQIQLVSYIDGSGGFPALDETQTLFATERIADDVSDENPVARDLYRQVIGREIGPSETVDRADLPIIEAYIRERLRDLRSDALSTRRAIPTSALKALCLDPDDLYEYFPAVEHARFHLDWDDLDESDLRVLDPEGLSLVTFRYRSPDAGFTFHLPFRVAEQFVAEQELYNLQASGGQREAGEFFGREITEEESLAYPVRELLEKLGVDASVVCPENLVDKDQHVARIEAERAARYRWRRMQAERYDFDEEWDE